MTQLDGLTVSHDGQRGVAAITLDVPEKMNRVSMLARDQIAALFEELSGDDSVRCVVLQGAGEQAFSAGGDVAGFLRAERTGPRSRLFTAGSRASSRRRSAAPRRARRRATAVFDH